MKQFLPTLAVLVVLGLCVPTTSGQLQGKAFHRLRAPTSSLQPAKRKLDSKSSFSKVPVFRDIGLLSGLKVQHISSPDKRYIIESMSGGVGLFDCDDDGRLDVLIVNGSTVERFREGGDPMVTLYHQESNGKFTDTTKRAGMLRKGWGMGVAVADFDNDGNLDVYVTGYGGNVLYRNKGNCSFEDVTQKAGVRGGGFSSGVAWADYDRDGYVDLFVSRYVHVEIDHLPAFGSTQFCHYKSIMVQCGPWGMVGERPFLFHNRGDGTFEEVSQKAGILDQGFPGLGVEWADYDNDGWPDLYVCNDASPNNLYHNNRDGTFQDVALPTGAALSGDAMAEGSMGVDWGDYDGDARLDMVVTNFAEQSNALYHNRGDHGFLDVRSSAGIAKDSFPLVGWGTALFDMDNDGWLDLFVASGHIYPQADTIPGSSKYAQPILLYRNLRNGAFEEVSAPAGLRALPLESRRGAAFGDIANTGNVDVLVLNVGKQPSLLLNTGESSNHRVLFKLVGTKSNRAAIGARLVLRAGGLTQFREVRGGGGYLSQSDLRLHFGLGVNDKIDSIQVLWPSGKVDEFKGVRADYIYKVVEDGGMQVMKRLPSLKRHSTS